MAMSFVNGNPRIDLGALAPLSGAGAMTIAAWIKLASTASDATIAIRGSVFATSAPWLVWRDDAAGVSGRTNTLSALLNTDAGVLRVESATDALNDTTDWHHIALVFEAGVGDGLRIYVDGVRDVHVTSTVGHANIVSNTANATAGIDDSARAFLGAMAELAFWDKPLSNQEILLLARGVAPAMLRASRDNLLAYHDLVRDENRPGIGTPATKHGVFTHAAHPRVRPLRGAAPVESAVPVLTAGPYQTASGEQRTTGIQAAQGLPAGAESGELYPSSAF